jgi:hypothetical protein
LEFPHGFAVSCVHQGILHWSHGASIFSLKSTDGDAVAGSAGSGDGGSLSNETADPSPFQQHWPSLSPWPAPRIKDIKPGQSLLRCKVTASMWRQDLKPFKALHRLMQQLLVDVGFP